jgi:hypothetical protein
MSESVTGTSRRRTGRDLRLVAAVRLVISDIQRSVAPAIAEARFFQCLDQVLEERDARPAERNRRESAEALREMETLGNTRDAAMKVAKRRAPGNPERQKILAQSYRKTRLRKKKRAGLV